MYVCVFRMDAMHDDDDDDDDAVVSVHVYVCASLPAPQVALSRCFPPPLHLQRAADVFPSFMAVVGAVKTALVGVQPTPMDGDNDPAKPVAAAAAAAGRQQQQLPKPKYAFLFFVVLFLFVVILRFWVFRCGRGEVGG